jgi:type VI secretion system protein ImpH
MVGKRSSLEERKDVLLEAAQRAPHSFDFFWLVRALDATSPLRLKTGYSIRSRSEELRFGNEPAPFFATSTLSSITRVQKDAEGPFRVLVKSFFMGLTGPNGPLPLRLTEFVYRRLHGIPDFEDDAQSSSSEKKSHYSPDPTLSSFFNLLEHRPISLFYRAWADARKTVDYDRKSERRFSRIFGSFHGEGAIPTRKAVLSGDDANFFSGHLGRHSRNPEGLERILSDYFDTDVSVRENFGHWLALPADSVCKIGSNPEVGLLGRNLVVGSRYWDCQLKYRVCLGPMGFRNYEKFFSPTETVGAETPGKSDARTALIEWVRTYSGLEFFVDAQLILSREEVPEISLGTSGILGFSTWLRDKPAERSASGEWAWLDCPPMPRDMDELIFELELERSTISTP